MTHFARLAPTNDAPTEMHNESRASSWRGSTAPAQEMNDYWKAAHGWAVTRSHLPRLRAHCHRPRFWLSRMEEVSNTKQLPAVRSRDYHPTISTTFQEPRIMRAQSIAT